MNRKALFFDIDGTLSLFLIIATRMFYLKKNQAVRKSCVY